MSGSWGPAATDTLSRWGHRLLTADDGSRRTFTGSVDGAPRWVGGLAAGLQAALLSLAVVVVPTVAAYVATSADPTNADVGWTGSVALGAGLWLLGHGSPLDLDGVRVTLIPLGVTALALFSAYASARRSGRPSRAGWAVGVAGYVAVTLVVALLSGGSEVLRAVVGGALVSAVGLGAGLLAQPGTPTVRDLSRPVWRRMPAAARAGAAGGLMAASSLVFVACGVVTGWLVAWRSSVGGVVASLEVDVVGWTTLVLGQLALVPDLVAWALAYVAGPGFAVGSGTHFTAAEIVSGPLPAFPVFGALPAPGSTTAWSAWLPLVTVLVGAGVGWWLHRLLPLGRWWHPLLACATAALVAGLGAGALVALASGSIGPGRMTEVGGSGLFVGAAVTIGTLVGSLAVTLPADAEVRSEAARRWHRVRPGGYVVVPDDTATGEVWIDRVGSDTEPDDGRGGAGPADGRGGAGAVDGRGGAGAVDGPVAPGGTKGDGAEDASGDASGDAIGDASGEAVGGGGGGRRSRPTRS